MLSKSGVSSKFCWVFVAQNTNLIKLIAFRLPLLIFLSTFISLSLSLFSITLFKNVLRMFVRIITQTIPLVKPIRTPGLLYLGYFLYN